MIVVPQEVNPKIDDDEIKTFVHKLSKVNNVVVIVPSNYRANYWNDVSDMTLSASERNLDDGIKALKKGHVGLAVFVNKYDGIDLPDKSCRVLVIDGLPSYISRIDRVEQAILADSEISQIPLIQRIEQGMGRGVRSNEDYCVVILMGRKLINKLYMQGALGKFSNATRAQMDLSSRLTEQIRGKGLDEIGKVIRYCLDQEKEWLAASRGTLVHIKYDNKLAVNPIAIRQREAFNYAQIDDIPKSIEFIQSIVNQSPDPQVKGWLELQLAEYWHFIDIVQSQKILKSALESNHSIIRPIAGVEYVRLNLSSLNQAETCFAYMHATYDDPNKMLISLNSIIDHLVFQPDTSELFEQAINDVGLHLGFTCQRPEKLSGKGPDVLWGIGALKYFIIECKNGCQGNTIAKHDCDQLSGSYNWFSNKYDSSCTGVPIIIHKTNVFEAACFPNPTSRIITAAKLQDFKDAITNFGRSVSGRNIWADTGSIARLLLSLHLTGNIIADYFTVRYEIKQR